MTTYFVKRPDGSTTRPRDSLTMAAWDYAVGAGGVLCQRGKDGTITPIAQGQIAQHVPGGPKRRPATRRCDRWHIKVDGIGVFVHVSWYEDGTPMELFLDVASIGSQLRGEFQLIGKLASHAWQHGQDPFEVCTQMQEVAYYSPPVHATGHDVLGQPVKSILEAVGRVLQAEFEAAGLRKA